MYSLKSRVFAAGTLALLCAAMIITGNSTRANGQATVQTSAEPAASAPKKEPLYVTVTLDDVFTQEIRVSSDESVSTGSRVEKTNWRVEVEPHRNGDQSVSLHLKLGKSVRDDKNGTPKIHTESFDRHVRLTKYDEPRQLPVPLPSTSSWQIKKVSVSVSKAPGISADLPAVAAPLSK